MLISGVSMRACLFLLAILVSCQAGQSDAAADARGENAAVVIVSVGNVDTGVMYRIASHMEAECSVRVRVEKKVRTIRSSVAEQTATLVRDVKHNERWLIGLIISPDHNAAFRSCVFPSRGIALCDMDSLIGDESLWSEAHQRRAIKESMRSWGLLMGLEDCPHFRCCLNRSRSLGDMDAKGADFCPPCQRRVDMILSAVSAASPVKK